MAVGGSLMNHEAEWVRDKDAPACHLCKSIFTLRKRRHHCRRCGNVVCDLCSQQKQELQPGEPPKRVCDVCVIVQIPDSFRAPDDPRPSQYAPVIHNPTLASLHSSPLLPSSSTTSSKYNTTSFVRTPVFKSDKQSVPLSFDDIATVRKKTVTTLPLVLTPATAAITTPSSTTATFTTEIIAPSERKNSFAPPVVRRTRSASLGAEIATSNGNDDLVAEFFKDVSEEVARKYNRHAPIAGKKTSTSTTTTTKDKQKKLQQGQTMQFPVPFRSPPPRHIRGPDKPRPFSKSPEVIRQLVALLASPPALKYLSQECERPFQTPAHSPSIDALEEILGKGQQVDFDSIPVPLKDHLPNLLRAYCTHSDYRFGNDAVSDSSAAQICASIIAEGRSFKTFAEMCAVFVPFKDVETAFLQVSC